MIELCSTCENYAGPADRTETEDGLEVTMAMNHFGHFLLTNLLIPHIKRTAEMTFATGSAAPRIVEVSSGMHAPQVGVNPQLDIDDINDDLNVRIIKHSILSA